MIGPAALPALSRYLADPSHDLWARIAAVSALKQIAHSAATARDGVVAALRSELEKWWRHDPTLNASLISALVDLRAAEAAPLMERAFAEERVDLFWRGDWEDIQVDLGLLPARETPSPRQGVLSGLTALLAPPLAPAPGAPSRGKPKGRKKAKRKMARESRRKNRRRR